MLDRTGNLRRIRTRGQARQRGARRRSVLADLQTPVGAFLRKIAGAAAHAFLLESIDGGERVARYSFLGRSVDDARGAEPRQSRTKRRA